MLLLAGVTLVYILLPQPFQIQFIFKNAFKLWCLLCEMMLDEYGMRFIWLLQIYSV